MLPALNQMHNAHDFFLKMQFFSNEIPALIIVAQKMCLQVVAGTSGTNTPLKIETTFGGFEFYNTAQDFFDVSLWPTDALNLYFFKGRLLGH